MSVKRRRAVSWSMAILPSRRARPAASAPSLCRPRRPISMDFDLAPVRGRADGLVIAFADQEIVLDDAYGTGRQGQDDLAVRLQVGFNTRISKTRRFSSIRQVQIVGARRPLPFGREAVFLQQVVRSRPCARDPLSGVRRTTADSSSTIDAMRFFGSASWKGSPPGVSVRMSHLRRSLPVRSMRHAHSLCRNWDRMQTLASCKVKISD